jgi:hypothetical protein
VSNKGLISNSIFHINRDIKLKCIQDILGGRDLQCLPSEKQLSLLSQKCYSFQVRSRHPYPLFWSIYQRIANCSAYSIYIGPCSLIRFFTFNFMYTNRVEWGRGPFRQTAQKEKWSSRQQLFKTSEVRNLK